MRGRRLLDAIRLSGFAQSCKLERWTADLLQVAAIIHEVPEELYPNVASAHLSSQVRSELLSHQVIHQGSDKPVVLPVVDRRATPYPPQSSEGKSIELCLAFSTS